MRLPSHRIIPTLLTAAMLLSAAPLHAQTNGNSGRWVISASAGVGLPTGRFGETDLKSSPPKSGNDPGPSFGGEAGYFISDFLLVGVAVSHSRFDLDFGTEEESLYPTDVARTSVTVAEITLRAVLANSLPWWKPYAVASVGLAGPKATVRYKEPRAFPSPDPQDPPIEVAEFKSEVDQSVTLSGGVGANVPLTRNFAVGIEGRYRNISSGGTDRTDTYTLGDGETLEVKDKAKSDTQWWDIRARLSITLP